MDWDFLLPSRDIKIRESNHELQLRIMVLAIETLKEH